MKNCQSIKKFQFTSSRGPWHGMVLYGKNYLTISAVNAWNKIQTAFGNVILKNLTTTQIETLLTKKCIEKY